MGSCQCPKCVPSAARASFPSHPRLPIPSPPPEAPRPESLRPELLRNGRSGGFSAKRGARADQVRKTDQPSVFPTRFRKTNREYPYKCMRTIILPCGILCHNRQGAPDRRCPEKRSGARRCPQRRSAAGGRPGNFLQNIERSVQFGKTAQAPVFRAYLPESNIERPCKNKERRSGRHNGLRHCRLLVARHPGQSGLPRTPIRGATIRCSQPPTATLR